MEGHDHHHHHQYGFTEIRQLMKNVGRLTSSSSPSQFPVTTVPSGLFSFNLAPAQPHHHQYQEMNFAPSGVLYGLCGDSSAANNSSIMASTSGTSGTMSGGGGGTAAFSGFFESGDGGGFGGGDGVGTGRWPRQETLTLLEIRSRLDHKFKEANQKGPLWEEVSRIMSEEHGYQRSGKKCREKFENLYKYYKKTKEGRAGRQDGKHYRFFRQLEALYGDSSKSVSCSETQFIRNNHHFDHAPTNNTNLLKSITDQEHLNNALTHHQKLSTGYNSLSLSNYNSSDLETSSSDGDDSISRRKRRSWKASIKEFIDSQMKKLIGRQEAWLENLTKTIKEKEQERILREEEWRKQEAARIEKERKLWAKEREWIEARNIAVIEALQNLTGRQHVKGSSSSPVEMTGNENQNENESDQTTTHNASVKEEINWTESEVTKLIELRTSMDSRFKQMISGCSDEFLWEEIAAKLVCLGYEHRSALMCKEKWEWIKNYITSNNKEFNKKRKEKENSSRGCGGYFPGKDDNNLQYNSDQISEQGRSETIRSLQHAVSSSCFPLFMGDGDPQNLWEGHGLRLNKGENR